MEEPDRVELKCCMLLNISSDDSLHLCHSLCPVKSCLHFQVSGSLMRNIMGVSLLSFILNDDCL